MICCLITIATIIALVCVLLIVLLVLYPLGLLAGLVVLGGRAAIGGAADALAYLGGGQAQIEGDAARTVPKYPYMRTYMTAADVAAAFKRIADYELRLVRADYRVYHVGRDVSMDFHGIDPPGPLLAVAQPDDYMTMNWLSNYYNEPCRVRCRRHDEAESPLEHWERNHAAYAGMDPCTAHDAVYAAVRGCNTFRPALMRGAIRMLGATCVLDPCAGWGDRLIGAIAAGVRYVGVDPAECVQAGYKRIIEGLAPGAGDASGDVATDGADARDRYTIIQSPFETAEIPPLPYDLVFTSPPYYELEVYNSEPTQSIATHQGPERWFNAFLLVLLGRAWDALIDGGYMVIIINNANSPRGADDPLDFVGRMVREFDPRGGRYLGPISYADDVGERDGRSGGPRYKSPQPMFIWHKGQHSIIAGVERCIGGANGAIGTSDADGADDSDSADGTGPS